jgi:hypothetical protein
MDHEAIDGGISLWAPWKRPGVQASRAAALCLIAAFFVFQRELDGTWLLKFPQLAQIPSITSYGCSL